MRESVAGSGGVGELEITPVSAAIARHLGIDLSQEGKAARNRRGIAIILHGAPMSGEMIFLFSSSKFFLPFFFSSFKMRYFDWFLLTERRNYLILHAVTVYLFVVGISFV